MTECTCHLEGSLLLLFTRALLPACLTVAQTSGFHALTRCTSSITKELALFTLADVGRPRG
jgi:hypothetical protein